MPDLLDVEGVLAEQDGCVVALDGVPDEIIPIAEGASVAGPDDPGIRFNEDTGHPVDRRLVERIGNLRYRTVNDERFHLRDLHGSLIPPSSTNYSVAFPSRRTCLEEPSSKTTLRSRGCPPRSCRTHWLPSR